MRYWLRSRVPVLMSVSVILSFEAIVFDADSTVDSSRVGKSTVNCCCFVSLLISCDTVYKPGVSNCRYEPATSDAAILVTFPSGYTRDKLDPFVLPCYIMLSPAV